MTWSEYKESWRDELAFWKRNPEIPLLHAFILSGYLYVIFSDQ